MRLSFNNLKAQEKYIPTSISGDKLHFEKLEKWSHLARYLAGVIDESAVRDDGSMPNFEEKLQAIDLVDEERAKRVYFHIYNQLFTDKELALSNPESGQIFEGSSYFANFSQVEDHQKEEFVKNALRLFLHASETKKSGYDQNQLNQFLTSIHNAEQKQFLAALAVSALCFDEESKQVSISFGVIEEFSHKQAFNQFLSILGDEQDQEKSALSCLAQFAKLDIPYQVFDGDIEFEEDELFKKEAEQFYSFSDDEFDGFLIDQEKTGFGQFEEWRISELDRNYAGFFYNDEPAETEHEDEKSEDVDSSQNSTLRYFSHLDRLHIESRPFSEKIENICLRFAEKKPDERVAIKVSEFDFDIPHIASSMKIGGGYCMLESRMGKNFEFRMNDDEFQKHESRFREKYEEQANMLLKHNIALLALEEVVKQLNLTSESSDDEESSESTSISNESKNGQSTKFRNLFRLLSTECTINEDDSLHQREQKHKLLQRNLREISFLQGLSEDFKDKINKIQQLDQDISISYQESTKTLFQKYSQLFSEDEDSSLSHAGVASSRQPRDDDKKKFFAVTKNAFELTRATAQKLEDQETKELCLKVPIDREDKFFDRFRRNTKRNRSKFWQERSDKWQSVDGSETHIAVPYRENGVNVVGDDRNLIIFDGNHDDFYFKHLGNGCYLKIICGNEEGKEYSFHDSRGQLLNQSLKFGEVVIDTAVYVINPKNNAVEIAPIGSKGFSGFFQKRLRGAMSKILGGEPKTFSNVAEKIEKKLKDELKNLHIISAKDGKVLDSKGFDYALGGEVEEKLTLGKAGKLQINASWKGFNDLKEGLEDNNISEFKTKNQIFDFNEDQKPFLSLGKNDEGEDIYVAFKNSALELEGKEYKLKEDGLVFFKVEENADSSGLIINKIDSTNNEFVACAQMMAAANFNIKLPHFFEKKPISQFSESQRAKISSSAIENLGNDDALSEVSYDLAQSDDVNEEERVLSKNPKIIKFVQQKNKEGEDSKLPVGKAVWMKSAVFREADIPCKPVAKLRERNRDLVADVSTEELVAEIAGERFGRAASSDLEAKSSSSFKTTTSRSEAPSLGAKQEVSASRELAEKALNSKPELDSKVKAWLETGSVSGVSGPPSANPHPSSASLLSESDSRRR